MKNNPYIFRFVLSFLLFVLLLPSCKKDKFCQDPSNPRCENYDPCLLAVAADSDFVIIDSLDRILDTAMSIEVVRFLAGAPGFFKATNKSMDTYEWQIGTHSGILTEPVASLNFTGFDGLIDVTLTTTINDENACFSASQLRSTTTKSVRIVDIGIHQSPVFGIYRGRNVGDSEADAYTVEVAAIFSPGGFEQRLDGIKLPPGCTIAPQGIPIVSSIQGVASAFRHNFIFTPCRNLILVGKLSDDNEDEITLDYWYDADNGSRKHEVFIGYRQ